MRKKHMARNRLSEKHFEEGVLPGPCGERLLQLRGGVREAADTDIGRKTLHREAQWAGRACRGPLAQGWAQRT